MSILKVLKMSLYPLQYDPGSISNKEKLKLKKT